MSTLIVISAFLALFAVQLFFWGLCLWVGLRWAKVNDVKIRRVALATFVVSALQFVLQFGVVVVGRTEVLPLWLLATAYLLATVLVPYVSVMLIFQASFIRSAQAWLPTLASPLVGFALGMYVLRPHVVEAFSNPTNAMSPTLLGDHWCGTCTACGSPAFSSPVPDYSSRLEPLMICRDNFHVMEPVSYGKEVFDGDRILVSKLLTPNRWDLVVFRYPEDPETMFVMRLVGLPGEEIMITEGQVWANGEVLAPPNPIQGINYDNEVEGMYRPLWGSPQEPAKLESDEYFVLGDFSPRSKDSRLWEHGAPGHNAFAVPESHLHGVVTHIYWPPSRWRLFR